MSVFNRHAAPVPYQLWLYTQWTVRYWCTAALNPGLFGSCHYRQLVGVVCEWALSLTVKFRKISHFSWGTSNVFNHADDVNRTRNLIHATAVIWSYILCTQSSMNWLLSVCDDINNWRHQIQQIMDEWLSSIRYKTTWSWIPVNPEHALPHPSPLTHCTQK